jgi:hypothetical protein
VTHIKVGEGVEDPAARVEVAGQDVVDQAQVVAAAPWRRPRDCESRATSPPCPSSPSTSARPG